MSEREIRKAKSAERQAEKELVDADELKKHPSHFAKKWARENRRQAKRLKSKAVRRQGKHICDLLMLGGDVDEEVECEEA